MVLLLCVCSSISIIAFSIYTGISPMPSSKSVRKIIINSMPPSASKIYELGSGWGNIAFSLARHFPKAEIIGYEISFIPWMISYLGKKILRLKNLKIYRKNFFNENLSNADAIFCYLYPGAMKKLGIKFFHEIHSDCLIVSSCFSLPGWNALKTISANDFGRSSVFIYKLPQEKAKPFLLLE